MKTALTYLLALTPAVAIAQPNVERAKSAYARGVELFKAEAYQEAIVEFNQAHRLDPSPVLLYNIARSFEQLTEFASAREFYVRYLAHPKVTDPDERARVEQTVRTLELLQKSKAEAAAGQTPEKTAKLPPDGPSEQVDAVAEVSPRGVWGWTAVGVGGALFAGAVLTGLKAQEHADQLDAIDANPGAFSDQDFDDAQSSGQAWGVTTDVLWGVGAASIGVGVWLLLTDDAPAATAGWIPLHNGVAYQGQF